ncbi:hypothetical protein [Paraburkholderia sp. 40]|uniref:hypothetical protein n=1 Tax=Paraburkholderia sp. 40 TaxID=2991059 RepID=UPI003D1938BF
MQQLDVFADSRDVMLRNDVLEQLQQRDVAAARIALALLGVEYPDDGALRGMAVLVRELGRESTAPLANHAALAIARRHLEDELAPAAWRVLPPHTVSAWLAPCWRSLARQAATLPFQSADADSHAAPLWLLAAAWAAASEAVEAIESWWRMPAPLAWRTEARYRMGGLDAAWPLLVELAGVAGAREVRGITARTGRRFARRATPAL